MADITVSTLGAKISPDTFTVTWSVTAAVSMPEEIFVFDYATQTFNRTANGSDLQWPTTRTAGQAWYRQSSATGTYGSITAGNTAKTNVDADIQALVDEYNAGLTTFTTQTSKNYT